MTHRWVMHWHLNSRFLINNKPTKRSMIVLPVSRRVGRMLPVLRSIIYAATGKKVQFDKSESSSGSTVEIVRNVVISELRIFLREVRSIAVNNVDSSGIEVFTLPKVLQFLSRNEKSLQRFIRRLSITSILKDSELKECLKSASSESLKDADCNLDFKLAFKELGWPFKKLADG